VSLRIRNNLERADWLFLRELCARTGNSGAPIERSRWSFFGEQWIGPYEKLRPEWSYVAELGPGQSRLGYLTGCPDTAVFLRERRWLFDLSLYLRARYGRADAGVDGARFIARFTGAERGPEECFPKGATRRVLEEYPAHLHTNLVEDARGKGTGRRLIDRYREDLARIGVPGIHLYCGVKPLAFYERVGFRVLDQIEFQPGVFVYRLGSRTSSG
jgi:GNAT superfamily N-acetyltransferase